MKIQIKGQEVELKNTIRSFIIYENITNKSFEPKNITDIVIYLYCVIMASKKDLEFTLDELIDLIDEDENILKEFNSWIEDVNKVNESLSSKNIESDSKKKKVKK